MVLQALPGQALSGQALAWALALGSLAMSGLLYWRIRSARGLGLWPLKVLAGSLAPLVAAGGAVGALLGLATGATLAAAGGALGAGLALWHTRRVAACRGEWAEAFGDVRAGDWLSPGHGRPHWQRDVAFCTLPADGGALLCDLWLPPEGLAPSGLAFVYCHGGGWHLADKDAATRPFFGHLAAHGHVVMDVAYRLCPQVGLYEMVGDVKRAIAWMRANAGRYGVNPERVVVAGGSAGAHLALLAAYTPGHPALTPDDLRGVDTTVCGVVSYYGPADMLDLHRHLSGMLPDGPALKGLTAGPVRRAIEWAVDALPGHPFRRQAWKLGGLGGAGMVANLLGGGPGQVPAMYELASPLSHAAAHCPPTLFIHGEHDAVIPVSAVRALYGRLVGCGVPVASLVLPGTDHIFDLVLPGVSPAARVALRHLDRFLAWLALGRPGEELRKR